MTVFGKPLSQVSKDDIERLIDRGVSEGRHLEFKEDIPVRPSDHGGNRRNSDPPSQDRFWVEKGHRINEYGRNEIVAELVAFANSDGGILILGIGESDDVPRRASSIKALPEVSELADRFRDILVDCIEPRLPYTDTKAVIFDDSGSGILAFEVAPSRLGPHRVLQSLRTPIRREDKCIAMSMSEIHDMVIRNARRFDEISKRLEQRADLFAEEVRSFLSATLYNADTKLGFDVIDSKLIAQNSAACAYRITIMPHDDLGIARLEMTTGLIPGRDCIRLVNGQSTCDVPEADIVWSSEGWGRRILGGIRQSSQNPARKFGYTILRDGFIEFMITWIKPQDQISAPIEWLVAAMACSLGIYDRLRLRAR